MLDHTQIHTGHTNRPTDSSSCVINPAQVLHPSGCSAQLHRRYNIEMRKQTVNTLTQHFLPAAVLFYIMPCMSVYDHTRHAELAVTYLTLLGTSTVCSVELKQTAACVLITGLIQRTGVWESEHLKALQANIKILVVDLFSVKLSQVRAEVLISGGLCILCRGHKGHCANMLENSITTLFCCLGHRVVVCLLGLGQIPKHLNHGCFILTWRWCNFWACRGVWLLWLNYIFNRCDIWPNVLL